MSTQDIRFVILALRILQSPRHRQTLVRLAMGRPMSPTRYRATSRNGDGTGSGLVIPRNNYGAFSEFLTFGQVLQWHLPVVTGPRTMFRNHSQPK